MVGTDGRGKRRTVASWQTGLALALGLLVLLSLGTTAAAASRPLHGIAAAAPALIAGSIPSESTANPRGAYSPNWAGYVVSAPLHSLSYVNGTWTEPYAHCTADTSKSVFWVGIDGWSSSTVEQIGTGASCTFGIPAYWSWYEMYPAAMVAFNVGIRPGDHVYASVRWHSDGYFGLYLKDLTTGKAFATAQLGTGTDRSSAEWVAEAPGNCCGGLWPLTDFSSVGFMKSYATIGGHTAKIAGLQALSGVTVWRVWMINEAGTAYKAVPSTLYAGSFSVYWKSAGP